MNTLPDMVAAFAELKQSLRAAIETYSNVHRGSGHFSMVTTRLFEQARRQVLEFVEVRASDAVVVFCAPRRAEILKAQCGAGLLRCLSSEQFGLALGVTALVAKRSALPHGAPSEAGGGTARLVSRDWVVWAKAPCKFEPGTPAIVNVIAFAKALQMTKRLGINRFERPPSTASSAEDILYKDELEALSGRELLEGLRRMHIGKEVLVPTRLGNQPFVNLDNGASTPTFEPIWQAFFETLRQPESTQTQIVREVRSICARALGAPSASYEVIFTSNTTEAINLVARSPGNEAAGGVEPVVLNTLLEHNSNELPWRTIAGHSLVRLPVDEEGFIDLEELEHLLRAYNENGEHGKQRVWLVAVSGASNVLGSFNDLAQIGQIARRYGARVLVDAAQLVAHRNVDMESWGIDYLAFSAHKMYAPFGSGALVARKGLLRFDPKELESIESSGDANAAGIAAMGKAFVLLQRIGMDVVQNEEQSLTAYVLEALSTIRTVRIFGVKSPNSARFAHKGGVIALTAKRPMPQHLARNLAECGGIGVRYGCHCSHLLVKRLHKIPPFLERVQWLIVNLFPNMELPGVLRVSLGLENSQEDIDRLIATLNEFARDSKAQIRGTPASTRLSQRDLRKQIDEFVLTVIRRVYA
jgi:selenocysteine lyase/cysteine desulfurase